MEGNRRSINRYILLGIFLLSLLFSQQSKAYDQFVAHPALTEQIALLFSAHSQGDEQKITSADIANLRQGAADEDIPPRWINHFYDPIHGNGWSGKHFGVLTQAQGYATGRNLAPRDSEPSIDWAIDQEAQASYGRQGGNHTWWKALHAYIDGDRQSAFLTLGHILHLVEDASVPDHTRDDSHVEILGDPGSPYEQTTKIYFKQHSLAVAHNLIAGKITLPLYDSLQQAIADVSKYSNTNFFSADTISNNEFNSPSLEKAKSVVLKTNIGDRKYLQEDNKILAEIKINGHEIVYTVNDDYYVMPSYRDHLFPKAVLSGAGVLKLFFADVEKYRQHPELLEPLYHDRNENFSTYFLKGLANNALTFVGNFGRATGFSLKSLVPSAKPPAPTTTPVVPAPQQEVLGEKIVGEIPKISVAASVPVPKSKLVDQSQPSQPVKSLPLNPPTTIAPSFTPPLNLPAGGGEGNRETLVATPAKVNKQPASVLVFTGGGGGSPVVEAVQSIVVETASIITTTTITTTTVDTTTTTITTTATPEATTTSTTASTTLSTSTSATSTVDTIVTSTTLVVSSTVASSTPPVLATPVISLNLTAAAILQVTLAAVTTSGDYFEIAYATSSFVTFVSTTDSFFATPAVRGQTYSVSARTIRGTEASGWSATSSLFINYSSEVVINEVAWPGTSALDPADQWFELYNTTDEAIDFSGWKVVISGVPVIFTSVATPVIPAHGYLLLEKNRDKAVADMSADILYVGNFGVSGNLLTVLKPTGEISDLVDASAGWYAGNANTYATMERIKPLVSGSLSTNWQTNQGPRLLGSSARSGRLRGSPRANNFGYILLDDSTLLSSFTLTANNNPYILTFYKVPAGETLTVGAGVVVKSYYPSSNIDVFGTLITKGTTTHPVIFTSGNDTTVIGGVLRQSPTTLAAGDWQGFVFEPGSVGFLEGAEVRYAGHPFYRDRYIFTTSAGRAVLAKQATFTSLNTKFVHDGPTHLRLEETPAVLINTTFSDGDRALESFGSSLNFDSVNFASFTNVSGPAFIADVWPTVTNITFASNTFNRLYLYSPVITASITADVNVPLYLGNFTIPVGVTLTLPAGTNLYLAPFVEVRVEGTLNAEGTLGQPVFVAASSASQTTFWGAIRFIGSRSTFNYTHFSGGHHLALTHPWDNGTLILERSTVELNHCTLTDDRPPGQTILATSSTLTMIGGLIGYTTKPTFPVIGARLNDGVTIFDDVHFQHIQTGIVQGTFPGGAPTFRNMNFSNFFDVDTIAEPSTLFNALGAI